MDKFDRIYQLDKVLRSHRHPVPQRVLLERLECSPATFKRIKRYMIDFLGAPIAYDRERNGYYYDAGGQAFELPGLWFNNSELYTLLAMQALLRQVTRGLLEPDLRSLRDRIESLLSGGRLESREISRRVRVLPSTVRPTDLDHFRLIATGLLRRQRLRILYHGRARDEITERDVSPQRLIFYRDNWYLDAWCHLRDGLRSFSLDRIHPVALLEEAALEVPEGELERHYGQAYGIFSGPARSRARLRFSARAAKWVADEQWHPQQKGKVNADGSFDLEIPFGDPTELVMDILRYGPDVEVLAPPSLRTLVTDRLRVALRQYADG